MSTELAAKNFVIKENINNYNVLINPELPSWVKYIDVKDINYLSMDSYQGIKNILVDEQFLLETNHLIKFSRRIRQMLNMEGIEECSNILLDFNPKDQSIIIHKILVYRGSEVIDKTDLSEKQIFRKEYGNLKVIMGNVTLSIILDSIKTNDVIDVSYSLVSINKLSIEFFYKFIQLEYGVPIGLLNFRLLARKNNSISYDFFGANKKQNLEKAESNELIIYSLERSDVSAIPLKKHTPYWYLNFTTLQIGLSKTWGDLAIENAKLYEEVEFTEKYLSGFLEELIKKELDDEQIAVEALHYINKNIRYLSNHTSTDNVIPTDPNVVSGRLYGDCKDLSYLLISILSKLNIKAYPVLVNSNLGKALHEFLPGFIFDHVIVLIEINNEKYFLDPTIRQNVDKLRYLYLPDFGYGLICSENSHGLVKIVNERTCSNSIFVDDQYEVLSLKENKVRFTCQVIFEGVSALRVLRNIENVPHDELWKSMIDSYKPTITVKETIKNEFDFTEAGKNRVGYRIEYLGSFPNLIRRKIQYSCEVLPYDLIVHNNFELPASINEDFYFGTKLNIDYKISFIKKKAGFKGLSENIIKDKSFSLSKICAGQKDKLTINYRFSKTDDVVLKECYDDFLKNQVLARRLFTSFITVNDKSGIRLFFEKIFRWTLYCLITIAILYIISQVSPVDNLQTSDQSQASSSTSINSSISDIPTTINCYDTSDGTNMTKCEGMSNGFTVNYLENGALLPGQYDFYESYTRNGLVNLVYKVPFEKKNLYFVAVSNNTKPNLKATPNEWAPLTDGNYQCTSTNPRNCPVIVENM